MIQQVILHIGQSKTGTSSLQAFLARNREALARHGILYPDILNKGAPIGAIAHNPVAESLVGIMRHPRLSAQEYFEQFARQCEQRRCHTLLLSGESFFSVPHIWTLERSSDYAACYRAKLDSLKTLIGGASCRVVVYLRRQDEWLESAIGQIIRYEGLVGRRLYSDDREALELLAPHMDYAGLLDQWDEVLKPAALIAVPYERDRLLDRDVVRDFVARAGLPIVPDRSEAVRDEHASLDWRYLWLKNILNRIDRSKTEERVIIDRLTVLNDALDRREKWVVAEELKAACRQRFAASNERLARRAGIAPAPFFTPPPPAPTQQASGRSDEARALEDGLAALVSFDQLYFSPATSLVRLRKSLASDLRSNHPRLHNAIRRLSGIALMR